MQIGRRVRDVAQVFALGGIDLDAGIRPALHAGIDLPLGRDGDVAMQVARYRPVSRRREVMRVHAEAVSCQRRHRRERQQRKCMRKCLHRKAPPWIVNHATAPAVSTSNSNSNAIYERVKVMRASAGT